MKEPIPHQKNMSLEVEQAFTNGWNRGRKSLRNRLLEVLEDNNHPIWSNENLQEDLIELVKSGVK